MSDPTDFDTQLLQQRAKFCAVSDSHLFELTQEQIERAFAPEPNKSARVSDD